MPVLAIRVILFIVVFVLFVPVRWRVWSGPENKDRRWRFSKATFGQMVAAERANKILWVPLWAIVLALLTLLFTSRLG